MPSKSKTSNDSVNVLIVNNSFYIRTRRKSVKLLARVFDHLDRR